MHRYTQSELNKMNLEALKSVCRERRIKSDIKGFYSDENTMRVLIYKYRGKEEPVEVEEEPPLIEEELVEVEEESIEVEEELVEVEEEPPLIEEEIIEVEEEKISGFIHGWDNERISFLQDVFKNNTPIEMDNFKITFRDDFEIYKDIDALDECKKGYKIFVELDEDMPENADISMTNAFIVDSKGEIQAILDVSKNVSKNRHYLNLRKGMLKQSIKTGIYNDFKILFFPIDFDKILYIYTEKDKRAIPFSYVVKNIKKTSIREIEKTDDVLFIDYGAYYTTAAVYTKNESTTEVSTRRNWKINQIYFYPDEICVFKPDVKTYYADLECSKCGKCGLCPSIIAVKDCTGDKIKFIYGHEAKKAIFSSSGTIFMDTKRWLNKIYEIVEIVDDEGNSSNIERIEIIKAFLQYIILCAEQQTKKRYKNICLLNYFEQKQDSLGIYKEILKDCNIIQETDKNLMFMNEAIAAIYYSLDQNKEVYYGRERRSILLIDCSSNSSHILKVDLAIENRNSGEGSIFDIAVRYERGIPSFGGNKLTYRLMQYIKIKLAHYYRNENLSTVKDLLGISYHDVYDFVDENGLEQIYEAFEEKYRAVKSFIPTNFNDYISEADILNVKRNFYFLWELAEQIKIYFYENTDAYEFSFDTLRNNSNNYYLSVKSDDSLEIYKDYPSIRILREDINLLFKPEIYAVMKRFIEPYYDDNTIYDMGDFIFLGQTTNIGLFGEILKEYIAGGKAGAGFNPYKKLKNIRGAALYYGDTSIGSISPCITYYPARQPYYLTTELFTNFSYENENEKSKILLREGQPLCELYSFIDRNYNTKKVAFTLRDYNKAALRVFEFGIDIHEYRETNENELKKRYKWLKYDDTDRQGDIDRIIPNSLRLFVYGDTENWGFSWVCIAKKENGDLYCSKEYVVTFEIAYVDYFDGRR